MDSNANKTAVFINSRGNPNKLAGVIHAMAGTAARPDLVIFCIRVDDDDPRSIEAIERLRGDDLVIRLYVGPRPMSLGAEVNKMARDMLDHGVGYYTIINDDTWPLTTEWDLQLHMGKLKGEVQGAKVKGAFLGCWTQTLAPTPDYPLWTREWLQAQGNIFPEYFPFWFDDMWLNSLAYLVYGTPTWRLPMTLCVKKTKVQRMRDTEFWWKFYEAMEFQRVMEAQTICDNLGMGIDVCKDRLDQVKKLRELVSGKAKEAAAVEFHVGDKSEPDPSYLAAKQRAEVLLAQVKEQFKKE